MSVDLVHDVFEPEGFNDKVKAFCLKLIELPPEAFAAGKLAIELAVELGRDQARNVERLAVSGLVMGDEYRTLMKAMQDRLASNRAAKT